MSETNIPRKNAPMNAIISLKPGKLKSSLPSKNASQIRRPKYRARQPKPNYCEYCFNCAKSMDYYLSILLKSYVKIIINRSIMASNRWETFKFWMNTQLTKLQLVK